MPATLSVSVLSKAWPVRGRRWAAAGLTASLLSLAALSVYHFLVRRAAPPTAHTELSIAARRANLETCTEGALLFHDVRWAAACMVLAQHDPLRDGSAECELPDTSAARLYELLHDAEQRCFAEARR